MFVEKKYDKKNLTLGEQLLKNIEEDSVEHIDDSEIKNDLLKKIKEGKLF